MRRDANWLKWFFWLLYLSPLLLITGGNLSGWDLNGHLYASKGFRDHIWPWLSGWNPDQLMGYPQGYFYPSLSHWLVGGLSKLLPLKISFYSFFVLNWAITPFLLVKLASVAPKDSPSKTRLTLFTGAAVSSLIFERSVLGGDLNGLFSLGLINQTLSLNLLLGFFIFLTKNAFEPRNSYAVNAGIFLGLTILSHAFIGLSGITCGIGYLFLNKNKFSSKIKEWLKVYSIGFFISLAWVGPFFEHRYFRSGVPSSFTFLDFIKDINWASFLGLGFSIATFTLFWLKIWKTKNSTDISSVNSSKRNQSATGIILSFLAPLLCFVVGFSVLEIIAPEFIFKFLPIHLYRFYSLIITLVIFSSAVFSFDFIERRFSSKMAKTFLFFFVIMGAVSGGLRFLRSPTIRAQIDDIKSPSARVLTVMGMQNPVRAYAPHFYNDLLSEKEFKLGSGLFVESSKMSTFTLNAIREAYLSGFVWGVEKIPVMPHLAIQHLKILGIQSIVSDLPASPALTKNVLFKDPKKYSLKFNLEWNKRVSGSLYRYELNFPLIERIESPKFFQDKDLWPDIVLNWWTLAEKQNEIPILSEADSSPASVASKVSLTHLSSNTISIQSDCQSPCWHYLRIPYFDNWKLSSPNSGLLRMAAPYFMAIKGQGNMTLNFVRTPFEIACQILALLLLGGLLIWGVKNP